MAMVKSKRVQSEHFRVLECARNIRIELWRYILHDFDKDGALAFMGESFLADERHELLNDAREIHAYIRAANSIYMATVEDYRTRRNFIGLALAACSRLSGEIDIIAEIFEKKINVTKYIRIAGSIHEETNMLKGWRKQTDDLFKKGNLI